MMKLAVSNIAWEKDLDEQISELLVSKGVRGIEVAPTKIWSDPINITEEQAMEYKYFWEHRGIEIIGAQSLLYDRPNLKLFDEGKDEAIDYIKKIIQLIAKLGGKVLVFGSPKNRTTFGRDINIINDQAIIIFREIAEFSQNLGCIFCIEPNPPQYECDYITNMKQALELVKKVNHPGFGLHLDTSCIFLNEEILDESMVSYSNYLKHVHISEPFLEKFNEDNIYNHSLVSKFLRKINYNSWISIEMKFQTIQTCSQDVSNAIDFVKRVYLVYE